MWQRRQNTRAVTGVGFEAAATAMIHAGIDEVCILHDLAARDALNVGDKANTARVMFHCWVVKPSFRWQSCGVQNGHQILEGAVLSGSQQYHQRSISQVGRSLCGAARCL